MSCRYGCRQNFAKFCLPLLHSLPLFFVFVFFFHLTHNYLFNTGDSYLKSVAALSCLRCRLAVYISLLVTLRKVFLELSCKALRWDKVITIYRPCIVQYRIVFSFHLAKLICQPDPGWDRKVRNCSLFLRWPLVYWEGGHAKKKNGFRWGPSQKNELRRRVTWNILAMLWNGIMF